MQENEEPKIIIDSDWKEQAQKEKEQLSEDIIEEEDEELTFLDIIQPIILETAIALGAASDDGIEPDLDVAEQNLEVLAILYKKTMGNLTKEEKEILETALGDLSSEFANQYFSDE